MKKMSNPIVFFGSGPVAAESLKRLAEDFTIEAVITKPRAKHHKGEVPVLDLAESLELAVLTAANRHELDQIFEGHPCTSKLGVLVDFGIIVSKKVIDYFPLGIVNSHFSILPEWRGADPITFAVLSGQKMTGVSLMLLVEAMDEGPLIAYGEQPLKADITTPALTEKLISLSDTLLKHELPTILNHQAKGAPQSITGREVSYSRKLTKEDSILDWTKPAIRLEREIRAFIAWPKSRTVIGGKEVIITKAHVVPGNSVEGRPGDIEKSLINDGIIMIDTSNGRLCIDRLKPAGKREMSTREFLAGNKP
jgi:methionyl-tRNA formyltransferase